MIPGPVELSEEVLKAMAEPVIGHRTPDFENILLECWGLLKDIYKTKGDIAIITGSGTSGMDASIASIIDKGDEVICITGGKFGERFIDIVSGYGGIAREVPVEWGRAVEPEDVEKAVSESNAKAITLTHNETSTGVLHDAEKIGKIAKENDMLFIVDAISSIGGNEFETDKWNIDLCIVGSQKCLAAPPGMAFVSVSERAGEVIDNNQTKNFYLNLASYKKSLGKKTTPFTPSVSLIYGLLEALKAVEREGLENRIKRHKMLAKATREAMKAITIELFADERVASNTVTSMKIPAGLTDDDVRGVMKGEHGILLAGGQAQVKGKIFRIGHMGNVMQEDLLEVISALEKTLERAGHDFEAGRGVKAAQEVFSG